MVNPEFHHKSLSKLERCKMPVATTQDGFDQMRDAQLAGILPVFINTLETGATDPEVTRWLTKAYAGTGLTYSRSTGMLRGLGEQEAAERAKTYGIPQINSHQDRGWHHDAPVIDPRGAQTVLVYQATFVGSASIQCLVMRPGKVPGRGTNLYRSVFHEQLPNGIVDIDIFEPRLYEGEVHRGRDVSLKVSGAGLVAHRFQTLPHPDDETNRVRVASSIILA